MVRMTIHDDVWAWDRGVVRDSSGAWQFGLCVGVLGGNPLAAELHALLMGLHLLWRRN